jgi:riboflavin kinase/FMN adenylyltransferase
LKSIHKLKKNTVITIGTFDGVHIGHQKIIQRLITVGQENDLEPAILTFFPHPRMVLQKDANIKLINTIDEKKDILSSFGLESLIIKEFTQEFSRLTAKEFVENILVNELKAKYIIIGYDHHFGRNRAANIDDLKAFGETYGFEVEEITAQDINDVAVSSTKIRNALLEGDIKTANEFLGYHFILNGAVVKGKGLGRTIDFPTANLQIQEDYKLIPKQGVYVAKAIYNNKTYFGMMNIGTNPTVNGEKQTIEVHFFDLNESLYGVHLQVKILKRLRDERKFESIEALKKQLYLDQQNALNYIKDNA